MTILEELIAPLSFQEFQENYLFKVPFAAPSTAKKFENLLSWDFLEEILVSNYQDCWLPQQGLLPTESQLSTGRLTVAQARKGFEEGRTLLIRHAELAHPKLKAIADDFYQIFHDPIDIQVYSTPKGEEGFNWHYDSEEVFVIQSVGEKEFRLRRNTINPWPLHSKLPKNMHFEQERPSPEIRCLLKAGDWLYIPAGWWHKAQAITDSCHLSVGVMALSGYGYLESILPALAENPLWRQRLPVRGLLEKQSPTAVETRREALRALRDHLTWYLNQDDKFLDHLNPGAPIKKV